VFEHLRTKEGVQSATRATKAAAKRQAKKRKAKKREGQIDAQRSIGKPSVPKVDYAMNEGGGKKEGGRHVPKNDKEHKKKRQEDLDIRPLHSSR